MCRRTQQLTAFSGPTAAPSPPLRSARVGAGTWLGRARRRGRGRPPGQRPRPRLRPAAPPGRVRACTRTAAVRQRRAGSQLGETCSKRTGAAWRMASSLGGISFFSACPPLLIAPCIAACPPTRLIPAWQCAPPHLIALYMAVCAPPPDCPLHKADGGQPARSQVLCRPLG